jgi:hypothetical protein
MYNDFQEKLDSGLHVLAKNEGKNGLPQAPALGGQANPEGAAVPDAAAEAAIRQQQIEANNTEDEIKQTRNNVTPSAFHRREEKPAVSLLTVTWNQNGQPSGPHQQSPRTPAPAPSKPPTAPAQRPASPNPATRPYQPAAKSANPNPATQRQQNMPTRPQQKTTTPRSAPRTPAKPMPHAGGTMKEPPMVPSGSYGRETTRFSNGMGTSLRTRSGAEAIFGANGKIASISFRGTTIRYAPNGARRVETFRSGNRIVSMGRNRGFVERPYFQRGGRSYITRTYVVNGVSFARVYTRFSYRGGFLYSYVPTYFYAPAFYSWVYTPWPGPAYYGGWGWSTAPWYEHYTYYFVPLPYYSSPALWLTDFLFGENLKSAYEAQQEVGPMVSGQPPPADHTLANFAALNSSRSLFDELKL